MRNNNGNPQRKSSRVDAEYSIADSCRDIPFKCTKCDSLLAFVDRETKSQIRVKYKDLYVFVQDPKSFSILCRSCGNLATITEQTDK